MRCNLQGIWTHNKTGNLYKVLGTATDSDSGVEMVIYTRVHKQEEEPNNFTRPLAEFLQEVSIEGGRHIARFTRVDRLTPKKKDKTLPPSCPGFGAQK